VLVIEHLAALGLRPTDVLGAGMEGTVVGLEGDLVAKVWAARTADQLAVLQSFYAAVSATLPLRCPVVLDVVPVGDRWATVEPLLPGTPMGFGLDERSVDAVVEVLDALRQADVSAAMMSLPALPGEPPLDVSDGFGRGLAGLVERRDSPMLRAVVPDLPELVAAVAERLRAAEPAVPSLVHGDLVAPNILVDDRGRPSAVLDFGFLTTIGDPAFDAAVTGSVFDMYSPEARRTESRLDRATGVDPDLAAVFRAAYAVVTSTCFSSTGGDGHFAWCVAMLQRPDVRGTLAK
jgi:aminoglycoside phosphotransferase (APT) family kinase protein